MDKISVIIPTMGKYSELNKLISDLLKSGLCSEIIIVDQGPQVDRSPIVDSTSILRVSPTERLSGSAARNFGAQRARREYVCFLDDDARCRFDQGRLGELLTVMDGKPDIIVLNRGEITPDGKERVTFKLSRGLNLWNFPRKTIEWNVIYKKSAFDEVGGFANLGPGSNHSAQCGESFVTIGRLLARGYRPDFCSSICVIHPSLGLNNSPFAKQNGYEYGAGYAVGILIADLSFHWRLLWIIRGLLAPIKTLKYGFRRARMRMFGFFDGVRGLLPKDVEFISKN